MSRITRMDWKTRVTRMAGDTRMTSVAWVTSVTRDELSGVTRITKMTKTVKGFNPGVISKG